MRLPCVLESKPCCVRPVRRCFRCGFQKLTKSRKRCASTASTRTHRHSPAGGSSPGFPCRKRLPCCQALPVAFVACRARAQRLALKLQARVRRPSSRRFAVEPRAIILEARPFPFQPCTFPFRLRIFPLETGSGCTEMWRVEASLHKNGMEMYVIAMEIRMFPWQCCEIATEMYPFPL